MKKRSEWILKNMNDLLKERLRELQTAKRILIGNKDKLLLKSEGLKKDYDDYKKAKWVISKVVEKTQQNFKDRVESLTTLMIRSIFDEPFEFKLIFEEKNNQLECRPAVFDNNDEYRADTDMGGSIVDVISFALRIILWSVENPQTRAVFFLDEPFRFVGRNTMLDRCGKLLRDISYKLNVQLIIITHESHLVEIADRAFHVKKVNKISTVTRMKG